MIKLTPKIRQLQPIFILDAHIINILFYHPFPFIQSMTEPSIFPYRKRFNTEIISKAEIALEAIKRYDMEQSRTNFLQLQRQSPQKTILKDLDKDYSMLTSSKKMQADRVYKINLLPHSQEFYYLQMENYVFPLKILVKNVRSEGVIYAGYDRDHPGIVGQAKKQIIEGQQVEVQKAQKRYDYKVAFNKDTLFTLHNKNNKDIKKVYFSIIGGSSLLMFHFKVQFQGFSRQPQFLSEAKPVKSKNEWSSSEKHSHSGLIRQQTQPNQFSPNKTKTILPYISKSNEKLVRLEDLQVFEKMEKQKSKEILSPETKKSVSYRLSNESAIKLTSCSSQKIVKNQRFVTAGSLEKSGIDQKQKEIKRNRQLLQLYKEKDKQLRETASKFKSLIQSYKKTYNEENARKSKLNRSIVLVMYSVLFTSNIHNHYRVNSKRVQSQFRITYICKKFARKLKKKHKQTCTMMPYRSKRYAYEAATSIDLQSKLIYRHSTNMAAKIIKESLLFLMPIFSINKALKTSNIYRNKIKFIQRVWRSKYHSRIYSLHYFIDNHIERMTKEFPHFRLFVQQFYKTNNNRNIALDYIKDESEKFRFIYEAYLRKLEEIEEMVQANKRLIQQKSQKPLLVVPKKPLRPMHRFYRNCDILKSMVRAWFQIQYKKYFKKSHPKYSK